MTSPTDPLKLITKFAAPLIKAVGREYQLRGADEKSIAFASIDGEFARSSSSASTLRIAGKRL